MTGSACIFYPNPDRDKRCKEFQSYLNYATAKGHLEAEGAPIDRYYEAYMCVAVYAHHLPPVSYFFTRPQETVAVLKRKIPIARTDMEILIISRILQNIQKAGSINVTCDKELLESWKTVIDKMRPSDLANAAWSFYQTTLAAPGPPCGQ